MAQLIIRNFIRELASVIDFPEPIVEFGALQVEPNQENDLRPLFPGREYVGTDIRPGSGVDRVEDLRSLSFGDEEVGSALCLDTLEHCEDPVQACRELFRVTKPGGVCVISSVMLFGIHGYPNDYFRFTPESFRSMLGGFDRVWALGIGDPGIPTQVIGVGAKRPNLELSLDLFPTLAAAQQEWEEAEGKIRIGPHRLPQRETIALVAREAVRNLRARTRKGLHRIRS